MQYIKMAVVGLIVGIVARFIYPGAIPMPWVLSMILGIVGSLLGGFISSKVSKSSDGQLRPAGFGWSIVGALIIIFGLNLLNSA